MPLKKLLLMLLLTILAFLCSCGEIDKVKTISDIAYNRIHEPLFLYVVEGNQYVPFLVLTDDYNGNTLLLRKDILEGTRRISDYSSFYENSEIDRYLNGEYYSNLSKNCKYIIPSNIEITSEEALGKSENKTVSIQRNVFLLSCNEIGIEESVNISLEGNELEYFKNEKNRVAYDHEHVASWWLRTPNTYYTSCTYVVGDNNKIGYTNAYDDNGIRPAFCVENDSPIELKTGVIDNQSAYVFSCEN